jgi:Trypsin-co-occurring domain 2
MSFFLRRIAPVVLLLTFMQGKTPAQQSNGQDILIDELIHQIQLGLANAQKDLAEEKMPTLNSVTLDLVTEAKVSAGGKINLYIVSFGTKWERDRSQEVEITLKPPSPTAPRPVGKQPAVSDQVMNAIVSAGRGVHAASTNKDVPLVATGIKVVINFVVKTDTSGGLKFTIAPVTADLSGDLANSAVQKITVLYQNPEPKK